MGQEQGTKRMSREAMDDSGLVTGCSGRPAHRDEAAMNGVQTRMMRGIGKQG